MENGTKLVRPNRRHFPRDLAAAEIGREESKFALSDTGILAVKYRAVKDKSNNKPKVVCLLTTDHPNNVAPGLRKTKTATRFSSQRVSLVTIVRWGVST